MSLRTRLLVALAGTVLVALVVVDVVTFVLVTRSQLDQVDSELERAHPPIERAASGADPEPALRDAAPGFYVELRGDDGTTTVVVPLRRPGEEPMSLVGRELPAPSAGDTDDDAVYASVAAEGDDHDLRVRVSRQLDGDVLVIGRSLDQLAESRERLLAVLIVATAGAVVVAVGVGAALVRVGMRPLVAVERGAASISDDDLDRRVPVPGGGGEIGRLATTINTMLDRLQRAFEQRQRDLEAVRASESRMRRFVADASHELRTPLAATSAYAELFERGARDRPDDLERAMAGIRTETARMARLVEDLLLLARLDEDRPPVRARVDLGGVVLDAVEAARTVAPAWPIDVRLHDVVVVDADADQLRQVIDNLLANVRTHTPPATPTRVEVRRAGGSATVSVADEGPGMGPDDAARAFVRFHRADASRDRSSGGSGLGLAIVAAIVEAHGGSVELESAPGRGTTVTVRIPEEVA